MTIAELNSLKVELTREILNEEDETMLYKIMKMLHTKQKMNNPPCQFTVNELKEIVAQSTEDAKNGRGVTIEEMRLKHPRI